MIRQILLILLFALTMLVAEAHYTVHNVVGNVTVESGGKSTPMTKGMSLKATDQIVIPSGGKVEILNTLDKRIYSSIKVGKISVTRLLIDAKGVASDNGSNVASRMQLGRKQGNGGEKVYVEKGMVRRSLAVYDPEGDGIEIDAATLGAYLADLIKKNRLQSSEETPVGLTSNKTGDNGLGFRLENTLDFPIYFNVVKLAGNGEIEISPLGQPAGSYVVLPRQSLSREHFSPLPDGERQIIIIANCQFDIDSMIEETKKALDAESGNATSVNLPIYVNTL